MHLIEDKPMLVTISYLCAFSGDKLISYFQSLLRKCRDFKASLSENFHIPLEIASKYADHISKKKKKIC